MGARLSLNNHKPGCNNISLESQGEACKRQRTLDSFWDENPRLIPSLPDEISVQILARLPRICHFNAKLVSKSWRAALRSRELYKIRQELGTTEEWLYILTKTHGDKLVWFALDPVSKIWQKLPLLPNIASEEGTRRGLSSLKLWNIVGSSAIADAIRSWLGRKAALDQISFCGCAVGAIGGCLYVLGGFCRTLAMNTVWCYDPIVNAWTEATPMSTGRAYCKTSVLNNKLYVVGGVTRGRGGLTPLQSAEVFDPSSGTWSDVPSMPFSKAQVLPTAFLADLLKPIATGMTSYRGKLYVPQSLYCWPFFVDVGGEVYDPETNSWVEMPVGMGEGWPARQAGTKLGAIVDGDLYALDPSNSIDSAQIKVYDHQDDSWKVIEGDVPIHDLTDSESPYLLASLLGKLHVVTKDVNNNILVVQADRQSRCDPGASTSASSSAAANLGESLQEFCETLPFSSENIWQVVASRSAGSAELVSCQILNI
ncbi:F-box/kelch-repeat protein At1g22040-like [Andrographis paniculata]|uniref:F-box/kelch-repeat protein At1g22040-like n=1 Tax=Andrographis paniculata TaxID=175694 RepID=UPI0021E74382|nr:F-box/kelch-repeat protein At1g22040-like [Andrographis paniculata]